MLRIFSASKTIGNRAASSFSSNITVKSTAGFGNHVESGKLDNDILSTASNKGNLHQEVPNVEHEKSFSQYREEVRDQDLQHPQDKTCKHDHRTKKGQGIEDHPENQNLG